MQLTTAWCFCMAGMLMIHVTRRQLDLMTLIPVVLCILSCHPAAWYSVQWNLLQTPLGSSCLSLTDKSPYIRVTVGMKSYAVVLVMWLCEILRNRILKYRIIIYSWRIWRNKYMAATWWVGSLGAKTYSAIEGKGLAHETNGWALVMQWQCWSVFQCRWKSYQANYESSTVSSVSFIAIYSSCCSK